MAIPPAGLQAVLDELRRARQFNPQGAIERKVFRLNDYFRAHSLDAVVVGLSGGVDSAVSLGLLLAASRAPDSPLRRVIAVIAPIEGRGATGQREAAALAQEVVAAAGGEAWVCDLSLVQAEYVAAMRAHSRSSAWSEGQLLSVVRTPAFYYAAAMLRAEGYCSLVVGTTNRDEGAYLGFFGKASDAMVDLQPISDLHKSEVYQLARCLAVPGKVLERPPAGDVFDGRTDLELIGAPYWAVELFLLARAAGKEVRGATPEEDALWRELCANIEAKHRENAHKYLVGNPSVHLDVYERSVPGGWSTGSVRLP